MESLGLLNVNENRRNSFCVDGNDAMKIKLVRNPEDLMSETCSFKPDMCHQVFGESEQIFGYKSLKIKLYYAAGNLTTYIGIEYDEKINTPGIEPDNIMEMLRNAIQSRFETNIMNFERLLQLDDSFRPHGSLINSFKKQDGLDLKTYEVYVNDTTDPNFLEYHKKVQTFVILYIDAANYVNPDEGNWKFFLLYEKYLSNNMVVKYAVVGYASVYEYYAYPSNIRPRVSQVVILPPFRCIGLCSKLLNSVYNYYITNRKVVDITVESPSQDFQRVRDFVDCKNCINLDAFSPSKLKQGFTEEIILQARDNFKINKKQARRIYEILRLKSTNIHNEDEYNAYLAEIKDRICRPNKKRIMKRRFWSYFASDPDDFYVPALPDNETFKDCDEDIEDEVLELKEQYDLVINRLNKSTE
uniref:Histone acetyltransferase type B catalytic subunit n=1 Tax=Panstrongylus megistus TaxID=65343 RepID=A0A069DTJ6_9HEMI